MQDLAQTQNYFTNSLGEPSLTSVSNNKWLRKPLYSKQDIKTGKRGWTEGNPHQPAPEEA